MRSRYCHLPRKQEDPALFDVFGGGKKKWHFKPIALLGNISKYQHKIATIGLFQIEIMSTYFNSICSSLMNLITKYGKHSHTMWTLAILFYSIIWKLVRQSLMNTCSYLSGVYTLHIIFWWVFCSFYEKDGIKFLSFKSVFSLGCSSYIWFLV